ncbi:MAG: diaminopimelate decarboxylase [Planctomycetota bacterium]
MLTHEQVKNIESRFGSPFYIFDEASFEKNYDDITSAFSRRYEKFILAYSYKTNYIPYLCGIIKSKGGYAEVVSRMEYDLALKIGQDPKKIIFNGPVKDYEDVEFALNNQSIVNLDSRYEVDYVRRYTADKPNRVAKVGLRINIDLTDESGVSHLQEGIRIGRFGFSPDDLPEIVSQLTKDGKTIINCLHGHSSTRDRSVWCYERIAKTLYDIGSQYAPQTVEYIDIGGGIYGYIPPQMRRAQTPSFDDYAKGVCDVLKGNSWAASRKPYLVLEPGVAMTANVLSYVTKVISVKSIRGNVLVTVDGSAFHTKPTFHKVNQPHSIVSKEKRGKRGTYSVCGATCMEKDYLLNDIDTIVPERGDYIKIDSVGAYTIVLSPTFIHPSPPIVVRKDGQYKQIRRKQNLMDMFGCYFFE